MSETVIRGFESGDVLCRGCGRTIRLHWNGGELDGDVCCGYVYRTVITGTALVIVNTNNFPRRSSPAN